MRAAHTLPMLLDVIGIRHVTAGVVGVRRIGWQNRPTFQQVVAFTRHRSRG